ncbi:MAG: Smr/MutS family protein [Cypionkella sp.]|nr:Smr/MutS family protein [Cypionkella sp.]
MSRRRTLHPEEQELWHSVARTAKPMHWRETLATQPPKPATPKPPHADLAPLPNFRLGQNAKMQTSARLAPSTGEALRAAPLRMDAKTHGKMTRGKLAPEGRIDLHGMTMDQAHPALNSFIQRSHAAGLRLVLVITGKGGRDRGDLGPIPQKTGVLRRQVPHWLHQPPLSHLILQVSESHITHGGGGALYVYLRRH